MQFTHLTRPLIPTPVCYWLVPAVDVPVPVRASVDQVLCPSTGSLLSHHEETSAALDLRRQVVQVRNLAKDIPRLQEPTFLNFLMLVTLTYPFCTFYINMCT